MRDLGRYVGAFQIAGFGPCLCATLAILAFCFLCMLQPSTDLCAYTDGGLTAHERGAGPVRIATRRHGRQGRQDINMAT